ncbi:hypothetical protein BU24DRAFT_487575 [Aaosphaeria arxii CBS 175.79]|uniref:Uncharacterized protein n=1 Tax=Aaosphaeria arxii CBS 175.79 TaxID=1450172 RepID=A0A6A5Y709_9PLEO|nr:uncharacterized protein BU24DRAFT_487575 [Aaosphaeria arxii CBS 175.79]KAF2021079.1 hypothetical protein BU24DRAFT_487575 [Aaosphaeria arxii CBS 175.79]
MPHDNNDNTNGRRSDHGDVENNPFIAFRRFADSHVSSLMNTVFTLPATLANYNNAYHAREQCLFGHADPEKCERLRRLENKTVELAEHGRELYRTGDVQAVLAKSDELLSLEREADELRRNIVEDARGVGSVEMEKYNSIEQNGKTSKCEDRHWNWSWNWEYPKSNNGHGRTNRDDEDDCTWPGRERNQEKAYREEDVRKQFDEEWEQMDANWKRLRRYMQDERAYAFRDEPRVWSWSFRWPPPADSSTDNNMQLERQERSGGESFGTFMDEVSRMFFQHPSPSSYEPYSPQTLEGDRRLQSTGIQWRDAYEDLMRTERGLELMDKSQLGQSRHLPYHQWSRRFLYPDFARPSGSPIPSHGQTPGRVPWEGEEANDEPHYEYAHDHEDQHDEPASPKIQDSQNQETELDAYERLLDPTNQPIRNSGDNQPSILSTLTTTERTVSPDGTITTKVVLKKRFSDGKEETSETTHTQHGEENVNKTYVPEQKNTVNEKKNSGWFWSG